MGDIMARFFDGVRRLACALDQHDPSERRRQDVVVKGTAMSITRCRACSAWLAREGNGWRTLTLRERESLRLQSLQDAPVPDDQFN